MKEHKLKVMPGSEAEKRLMELFKKTNSYFELFIGRDHNEYIFDDGVYKTIKQYLKEEGSA